MKNGKFDLKTFLNMEMMVSYMETSFQDLGLILMKKPLSNTHRHILLQPGHKPVIMMVLSKRRN